IIILPERTVPPISMSRRARWSPPHFLSIYRASGRAREQKFLSGLSAQNAWWRFHKPKGARDGKCAREGCCDGQKRVTGDAGVRQAAEPQGSEPHGNAARVSQPAQPEASDEQLYWQAIRVCHKIR